MLDFYLFEAPNHLVPITLPRLTLILFTDFLNCFVLLLAERKLPTSNLKPIKELGTRRLEKAISPNKIHGLQDKVLSDMFLQNLTTINKFLFYVEAEAFVSPEKAENQKPVIFKNVKTE